MRLKSILLRIANKKNVIMKTTLLLFISVFLTFVTLGQVDCADADPICSDNGFNFTINQVGSGFNDLPANLTVSNPGSGQGPNNGNPNSSGCLNSDELNPVWLTITVQNPGELEFAIGQNGGNGFYDWAMWPYYDDGTNSACNDITNNTLAPVACNWNSSSAGYTGMTSQGFLPPGGVQGNFEYALNVNAGDQFVICFSNYSGLNSVNVPISFGNDIPGNNNSSTASVTCDANAGNQTICLGETATVNINTFGVSNPTFNWLVTNNVNDPAAGTGVLVNPTVTTDYEVEVLENGVVMDTAEFTITVVNPPAPNAGPDQQLCLGTPIQMSGIPSDSSNTCLWTVDVSQVPITPSISYSPNATAWSPTITTNQLGSYVFVMTESNPVCGDVTDSVTIVVDHLQVSASQVSPSCIDSVDGEIHIISENAIEYSFDNGVTWQADSFAVVFGAGTYDVCARTVLGCENCTQVTVIDPDPVIIEAFSDTLICQNGTANLWAVAQNGTSFDYHWSHVADFGANQICNPTVDTWYYVHATNENGCPSDQDSVYVTLHQPLTASISPFDTICPGYPTEVTAQVSGGIGAPYTFNWTNVATNTTQGTDMIPANPPVTTTYEVTISDACETTPVVLSTEVYVAPLPIPQVEVLNPIQCEPAVFDIVNTTDPALSQNTYWSLGELEYVNQDTITSQTFMAGDYDLYLMVSTPLGCIDSVTFEDLLTVKPTPTAGFNYSPNPVFAFNTEVYFNNASQGADTYQWYFDGGVPSQSTDQDDQSTFPDGVTGDYNITLIATSDLGCADTLTRVLRVFPEVLIYAPNTFTPDGDEFNQTWKAVMQGIDFTGFNLLIFDRWGEIVWESNDIEVGWDGTYLGRNLPKGVYTWKIVAKDAQTDEKYEYSGHINLLR